MNSTSTTTMMAILLIAAAAASALSAIPNSIAAYADWPKSVEYRVENEQGDSASTTTECLHPQPCKEFLGANPNQHAKSSCEELSDLFIGGEKCKKVKEE